MTETPEKTTVAGKLERRIVDAVAAELDEEIGRLHKSGLHFAASALKDALLDRADDIVSIKAMQEELNLTRRSHEELRILGECFHNPNKRSVFCLVTDAIEGVTKQRNDAMEQAKELRTSRDELSDTLEAIGKVADNTEYASRLNQLNDIRRLCSSVSLPDTRADELQLAVSRLEKENAELRGLPRTFPGDGKQLPPGVYTSSEYCEWQAFIVSDAFPHAAIIGETYTLLCRLPQ